MDILHRAYFGNEILRYFIAAGILIVGILAVRALQYVLLKGVNRWANGTKNQWDDFMLVMFPKAAMPLAYYAVVYFAFRSLVLNRALEKILAVIGTILLTFIAVRLILHVVRFVLFEIVLKRQSDATHLQRQAKALMPIISVVIWSLGIIFLLDNLGFKISTLVAGLGIGGVALALASQTVLGDMFSYMAIMLDKPFELDDFIVINDFMGTVEHIGIKTTRLRSLTGEQVIVSNKDLTDSRVRNYKRMDLRRIEFRIGVAHDTPNEKLQKATQLIQGIIQGIPQTRFDRAHFSAFDESKVILEIVYFVLSADYNLYMDIHQKINLGIKSSFEKEDIQFGLPRREIRLLSDHIEQPERRPPMAPALS